MGSCCGVRRMHRDFLYQIRFHSLKKASINKKRYRNTVHTGSSAQGGGSPFPLPFLG